MGKMESVTAAQLRGNVEAIAESIERNGDVLDWLEGSLEIVPMYGQTGELLRLEVLVGFGGPNLWVFFDLRRETAEVKGYWGADRAERVVGVSSDWVETLCDVYQSLKV